MTEILTLIGSTVLVDFVVEICMKVKNIRDCEIAQGLDHGKTNISHGRDLRLWFISQEKGARR